MKNITLNLNPIKLIVNIVKRYNFTLFFVVLVSGLIIAIIMLTNIFTQPNDTNLNDDVNARAVDQVTIERLNKLEKSNSNINYKSLPIIRNLFSE